MKRFGRRPLAAVLILCMLTCLFCVHASAIQDSSAYLSSYTAFVTPESGGRIYVTVDVDPVGSADVVGATSIHIYESTDNVNFEHVYSFYAEDYPDMLGSGSDYYDTPVVYYGTPGRYYSATVYFYAEKNGGSDWAMYDTVAKRAIE